MKVEDKIWSLAWILGVLLVWRGGLMNWQILGAFLLACGILFFYLSSPQPSFLREPVERLSLLGLLYLGLACFWSIFFFLSLEYVCFLGVAWLLWMALRRNGCPWPRVWLAGLQLAFVILVCAACLWLGWKLKNMPQGLPYFFANSGTLVRDALRPFFPNQNLLVGALVPISFLSFSDFAEGKKRAWNLLVMTCFGFFLVLSGSRGGLLSLVLGSLWFLLHYYRLKSGKAWGPLLIKAAFFYGGIAALVFLPLSSWWLRRQHAHNDPFYLWRSQIWKYTWLLWRSRFLAGWGPGVFEQAFEKAGLAVPLMPLNPLARFRFSADFAHQEWLQAGLEWGLGGLLIVVGCGALMVKDAIQKPATSLWEAGLEAALLAILVHSSVDFNLHCPLILFLFIVFLAWRFPTKQGPINSGQSINSFKFTILAVPLTFALCLAFAFYLKKDLKSLNERDSDYAQKKLSLAQEGLAFSPHDPELLMQQGKAQAQLALQGTPDLQQLKKAMQSLESASRLAPEWSRCRYEYFSLLNVILFSAKKEAVFESLGPLDWRWDSLRAQSHQMPASESFLNIALQEADACLDDSPFFLPAAMDKALLLARVGKDQAAQGAFDAAIDIEPNCAKAWEMKAKLAEEQGNKALMSECLQKLMNIEPIQPVEDDLYEKSLKQADWLWVKAKAKSLGLKQGSPYT